MLGSSFLRTAKIMNKYRNIHGVATTITMDEIWKNSLVGWGGLIRWCRKGTGKNNIKLT